MDTEFDWLTLDDDEAVLWADTPHPYSLVPSFIVGVPLSFVLVGIPLLVGSYLSHKNTNYVVTSDALYRKTGVLSRSVQRIEFDKVQDTSYSQTFLGAQFGYGSVNISTAGGSGIEMSFQNVADPQSLQTLVNERIKRRAGPETDAEGKAAVLDDILTELRAIRRAVEGEGNDGGEGENVADTSDDVTDRAGDEPDADPGSDASADAIEPSDFEFDATTDER
ncbi:PH domain-containing protein [Haloferax denitrificans]|uniref:YdbS-like PH domain-containing protein n=1 Tax=Haloferax denitrificans ATCC 35960 TaxID=662478 RepID=M0JHI8_9EURY|nr:PH domain-containing protein [Haloferax denitrificans]EMA07140.1 hypothetical protein C438_04357 [Haloferax denitrificans ATCC 35960]